MSLKTSNDYHSHFSHPHISSSCFCCYLNAPQPQQLSIPYEKSFIVSDEQIQLKQITNTHLDNRNQWHNVNTVTKQSYQPTNSTTQTIPTSADDHLVKKIHRQYSQKKEKNEPSVQQHWSQISSLISQRHETAIENQQLSLISSITALRDSAENISDAELTDLLNKLTLIIKSFDNTKQQQQQLLVLSDILDILIHIRPSILTSISQNKFFSILAISFVGILRQWRRLSSLPDTESFMFRNMTTLFSLVINNTNNISQLPSWLSDFTLLQAISDCLTDIVTSGKLLNEKNQREFKHLIHLIDTYIGYQEQLNNETNSNKDTLVQLVDPILQCITSTHFIDTFTNIQTNRKSMTTMEKFFLVKCPAFLISYTGSRLEQTMEDLLSTMLPRYVTLLDKLIPSVNNWKQSAIRAMLYLLKTINHGASQFQMNAKLVSAHLRLIDHVLKLVDQPIFYNNLQKTLSNTETIFISTAVNFLVNMINEPAILAYIKQSQVTPVFLRLTSCQYEPLVLNVYTLLAYTTHEEDIKAMDNPGRLLSIIIESLKTTLDQKPNNRTQIEQLLETLKGLVQHDQIKDAIIKQNSLPFLLACVNTLTRKALVLIFEILWSLTFFEDIARVLRDDAGFLEKIETISKDNSNEPLKKAAAGLVWKLIQEPAFLEKVAKQEKEEKKEEANAAETIAVTEVIIGADGEEQLITRRASVTPSERSYRYDIMISYCHADKELTYKIHRFLISQGFKVWIDLDNMYGPAMSAMADAVENSEFVIMCMSDSYKQSTYCQAEAEYAFKCKRCLIPLIMRPDYKPDGWLGFMIGTRMYVDYGRFDFETACERLMTEFSLQRQQSKSLALVSLLLEKTPVETLPVPIKSVRQSIPSLTERHPKKSSLNKNRSSSVIKPRQPKVDFMRKPINQWTESDVSDFLLAQRLNALLPLCEGMDGYALMQLYKICTSRRLRAYSVLKDELKSTGKMNLSLSVYSRFLSDVERAINSPPILPPVNPSMMMATIPFKPASNFDNSCDFVITSDASPLDILKMVDKYSSQLQILDSLRRRISSVF